MNNHQYSEWWRYTNQSTVIAKYAEFQRALEQAQWSAASFTEWFDQWGQYLPDQCYVLELCPESPQGAQLWQMQGAGVKQKAAAALWSHHIGMIGEPERKAFDFFLAKDQLCQQWFDTKPKVRQVSINIPQGALFIFQAAHPQKPELLRLSFREQRGPLTCLRLFAPPVSGAASSRNSSAAYWYPQALWIDCQQTSAPLTLLDHQPWSQCSQGSELSCSSWSTCTSDQDHSTISFNQWPQYAGVLKNHVYLPLSKTGQKIDYASLLELKHGEHSEILVETAHLVGHTESTQQLRALLNGESTSIQRGKITMLEGAVQSVASHQSHHLSLSNKARTVATPELSIAVDDVKCSHGSTNGHLSEEDLFFLCSRGLSREQATGLLTQAFSQRFFLTSGLEAWACLIKAKEQPIPAPAAKKTTL